MKKLSHYDSSGAARMVDVSAKSESKRTARAHAFVRIAPAVLEKLPENPKGNPLEIARIAGISASKRTSELIPLCHPLMLSHADVEIAIEASGVRIEATASTTAQTGVEMEALTAAAVAALTVYDMTKALDKSIEISELYLLEKTGGKSGPWRRAGASRQAEQQGGEGSVRARRAQAGRPAPRAAGAAAIRDRSRRQAGGLSYSGGGP
jgi:cyclic pyranopterin monophosphate synthase